MIRQGRKPETSARLREAAGADVPSIVTVTNATFAIETFLDATRTGEEQVRALMRKGCFLVAEDDAGRIVASVFVEVRGTRGYFGMLAVDSARQGAGLGARMVRAAESRCREQGCEGMDITVLNRRPELLPFYRALGYIETGTQEFHPERPVKDNVECYCIVMSKAPL